MSTRRIAILIDGGYFLHRLPKLVPPARCATPERIAGCLRHLCHNHVLSLTNCPRDRWQEHVYRIFYYDSAPYDGKAHHPIDNRPLDFAKSDVATERRALFDCLKRQRKFALRLGKVNREHDWAIKPQLTKKLLRSREAFMPLPDGLVPDDNGNIHLTLTAQDYQRLVDSRTVWQSLNSGSVALGLRQKGVDMRIGLDIASLSLKRQVDTIVLVSGDSDFVPAAKLARREGVDFILDPMWQQINADLFEHIDGLQSGLAKPGQRTGRQAATSQP
ncbi:MAG: NYN domain-containing protein [Nitrosomonas halophila]